MSTYTIEPEQFGLQKGDVSSLAVDGAEQSLAVINDVLANKPGAARDIALLNAGAAIYTSGVADSLESGINKAKEVIENGAAKAKFAELVQFSESL